MAFYRILSLAWPVDKAIKELNKIWQPDEIWQSFIDDQLTNFSIAATK